MSFKQSGFNRYEPPSPSLKGDENNEETFLKDVDRIYDRLPQPFRRIDKLVWEIFEQAWIIIEQNEQEINYKQSTKLNLTKILYEEELIIHSTVHCLSTCDGYAFVGLQSRIFVYELPSLNKVGCYDWCEEEVSNVQNIYIICNSDDLVLLLAVDSRGLIKILGFKTDEFHVIDDFGQQDEDESHSSIADKISLSEDSSYLAISWEDASGQWLDVYRLPKEEWQSQLENFQATKSNNEETNDDQEEKHPESTEMDQIVSNSTTTLTFTKLQHIIHIKPPIVKANSASSISSVLKNIDIESSVIGSGSHHFLTATFFEHLHNEFKAKSKWSGDADLTERMDTVATTHFLKGQITSSLFPSRGNVNEDSTYNAIAVWWKDSNQIYIYTLKSTKDLEPAPFSVLPHADNLKLSSVNAQTDLIAVSLVNRCISVWNRYVGQPLKVFMPVENQNITMLCFSSVYHGKLQNNLIYSTEHGKLYEMTCERNDITDPILLDDRSATMFEDDQVLQIVDGPMNLLTVIWKSGQVIIYNEASLQALCQLEFFNEEAANEANGSKLNVAYTKGNILTTRDESIDGNTTSRLFLFEPDEYPILQPFFHFLFVTEEEDEEKVNNLEKNFLSFLRRRKLSDESLQARIRTQRRDVATAHS